MSIKNDKSAIIIIIFAALFILFAFIKQAEEKTVSKIITVKYINSGVLGTSYNLESKINKQWYHTEVDIKIYNSVEVGNYYQANWRPK